MASSGESTRARKRAFEAQFRPGRNRKRGRWRACSSAISGVTRRRRCKGGAIVFWNPECSAVTKIGPSSSGAGPGRRKRGSVAGTPWADVMLCALASSGPRAGAPPAAAPAPPALTPQELLESGPRPSGLGTRPAQGLAQGADRAGKGRRISLGPSSHLQCQRAPLLWARGPAS